MVNAIISNHYLGVNNNGIPFIQLNFVIKGSEDEPMGRCSTSPIFLINKGEDYEHSAAAAAICAILEIVGVDIWENLDGVAVQVELDKAGTITKLANILDENKYVVLRHTEPVEEVTEITE